MARLVLLVAILPLSVACYEGSRIPPARTATTTPRAAAAVTAAPTLSSGEPNFGTYLASGSSRACWEGRGYAVVPIYSTLGVAAFGVIYDTSKEDELRTDANTCYAERKCAEDPTRDFCAKPPAEALQ